MFGTDGIRGRAYRDVTPEVAARIGAAVVETFGCARVVLGHDPRSSAADLVGGLLRGLSGTEVDLLGVAPTPAVAFCSAADGVPGIVVSASHNPYQDNGVKIFGPGGRKLSDAEQEAVAAALRSGIEATGPPAAGVEAADRLERVSRLRGGHRGAGRIRRAAAGGGRRQRGGLGTGAGAAAAPRSRGANRRLRAQRAEHQRRLRGDHPEPDRRPDAPRRDRLWHSTATGTGSWRTIGG